MPFDAVMTQAPPVDFLCIGGMRCGTTSLWTMLRAHPGVFLPDTKELHYFDSDRAVNDPTLAEYRTNFVAARPGQLRGEFTPAYLTREGVAERIGSAVPDARIIAILRDPVARAWSHYWFRVRQGREGLSFTAALRRERERQFTHTGWQFAYAAWSMYAPRIDLYHRLFGKDRVRVVFFEDIVADPQRVGRGIAEFLGVDADPLTKPQSFAHANEMTVPRFRPLYTASKRMERAFHGTRGPARLAYRAAFHLARWNMVERTRPTPPAIGARLAKRFEESDARLAEILGRPLPWRSPAREGERRD